MATSKALYSKTHFTLLALYVAVSQLRNVWVIWGETSNSLFLLTSKFIVNVKGGLFDYGETHYLLLNKTKKQLRKGRREEVQVYSE